MIQRPLLLQQWYLEYSYDSWIQTMERPVLQVDHAQVGVLVPDGETAIRRLREQQEPPVGRDAGEGGVQAAFHRVIDRFEPVSERERFRIEGDRPDAVADVPVALRHLGLGGGTEIQCPAVRRPGRHRLEARGVRQQGRG